MTKQATQTVQAEVANPIDFVNDYRIFRVWVYPSGKIQAEEGVMGPDGYVTVKKLSEVTAQALADIAKEDGLV